MKQQVDNEWSRNWNSSYQTRSFPWRFIMTAAICYYSNTTHSHYEQHRARIPDLKERPKDFILIEYEGFKNILKQKA